MFRDASTIKILTTEPAVGEHWSNLWLVVIYRQPYIRLGDHAYGRIEKNTTSDSTENQQSATDRSERRVAAIGSRSRA